MTWVTKQWLIADISINWKRDRPSPPGKYPPESESFSELKRMVSSKGMLLPVFVDKEGVCLSGHYRLWAAQSLGFKTVPVVQVSNFVEVNKWMETHKGE
jgi:ParB-like chromosome segregation protein Spo0J